MLKILQAKLKQSVNWELPDVQAELQRGQGTKGQIVNIHWIIEKAKKFQKNNYFCFIDYAKTFDCVGHNKLWKILRVSNSAFLIHNFPPFVKVIIFLQNLKGY